MTRQLFDEFIGDSPPSSIDVDALVKREKRRRSARRGGGLATAALLLVGAAWAWTGQPGPAERAGDPTVQAGAPSSTVDGGFRLVADNRASAAATAGSLRTALDRALRSAVPDARWVTTDIDGNPAPDGQPPKLTGDDRADQMFSGGTGVEVDGARGSLVLQIISTRPCADPANPKCALERDNPDREQRLRQDLLFSCQPKAPACAVGVGPRGERLLMQTVSSRPAGAPAPATVSHEVLVLLADGRALSIAVSNEFAERGGRAFVHQSAPPLGRDEIRAMATDVGGLIRP